MTVAVAHTSSQNGRRALAAAVEEARLRATDLAVLHVVGSIDNDTVEAYRAGIADEVEAAVAGGSEVRWDLHLRTAPSVGEVDETLVALVEAVAPDLVVVGSRRRSPLGKALLGSITQTLILESSARVLVVSPPRS